MTELNTGINRKKQALKGLDAVLLFFLKLYKLQQGVDPSAESRVELAPLAEDNPESDRVYTLRVNHQGVWRSRRMSLGRLGANIANKSMCYRIIFDDLMVVKVPPQPIREFNDYIECIRRDWRIAERAGPSIRCIIPSLAALLNKIPQLHHPEVQSPEEMEKRYIYLLRKDPGLQNYLKIGDSFVFFMSLSRYVFLNQEIEKIHDRSGLLSSDLLKPSDPLWETHGMDSFHMADGDSAAFEMGQVLSEYESRVSDLLEQCGDDASASVTQRRTWFSNHLSGRDLEIEGSGLPEAFLQRLPSLLKTLSTEHRNALDTYLSACRKHGEKIWLDRNKGKIRGIIAGIVTLLSDLKTQAVAVRDLKPENVFIMADPERLEQAMLEPGALELGLIDLETALILDPDPEALEQPLCTGTPAYSTPSHLFPNPLLKEIFGDLKPIFLLQDAYAATGLVFYAATGKALFEKTGRLLPEIVLAAQKSSLRDRTSADLFQHASWVFWHSAVSELAQRWVEHLPFLRSMDIPLAEPARLMLQETLAGTEAHLKVRISALFSSQSFLQETQVRALAEADVGALSRQIRSLEAKSASANPQTLEKVMRFLLSLEHLKRLVEQGSRYRSLLSENGGSFSADDLIRALFFIAMAFMYRESWTTRKHPVFPEKIPAE